MGTRNLVEHVLTAVDVKTSLQASEWLDLGDAAGEGAEFHLELKTLAGGTTPTVAFDIEHSANKSTVTTLKGDLAALNAVGVQQFITAGPVHRFVRYQWTVTGAPTGATADFLVRAVRR